MPQEPFEFVAYIDEAGDEGFGRLNLPDPGRQSRWFLLGAAIVEGVNDPMMPSWRDAILDRFPRKQKREIHFRDLRHEQKVVVAQELSGLPLKCCVAFSNKITLCGTRWADIYKRPGHLYNYMTRWLLERITTYCADEARKRGTTGRLKVIFSRRENTDYQSMMDYMILMKEGREVIQPVRSINWGVFDPKDIAVENHSVRAGLQLADSFVSAFFNAVEPNGYGNTETTYAEILRTAPIRKGNNALNCGITPVPSLHGCRAPDATADFFRSFTR